MQFALSDVSFSGLVSVCCYYFCCYYLSLSLLVKRQWKQPDPAPPSQSEMNGLGNLIKQEGAQALCEGPG